MNNVPNPVPPVSTKVHVETPEQIQFTFEVAGVGQRVMAYGLDLLIRIGLIAVLTVIVVIITGGQPFGFGVVAVVSFFIEWGYHTILEWRLNGVTPGKKAFSLRVVRTDGISIDLYRSAMRNLLRVADGFPPMFAFLGLFPFPSYAVGLLVIFAVGTGRRLGDIVADTMVIREETVRLKALPPLPETAVSLPKGAVARSRLQSRELALVDEFFRRRRLFSNERAEEMATIIAKPVAARLGVSTTDPEQLLAALLMTGEEERDSYFSIGRATPNRPNRTPSGGNG